MESRQSSARGVVVLVVVLAVSALLGGLWGPSVRATAADTGDLQDSVKSFTRVLSVVERNYAEPVDTDKVIYEGAIPGMLRVLDPHSNFFDPKQYALFKEEQQGKYYGVGMTVQSRDNQTVVLVAVRRFPCLQSRHSPGRHHPESGRQAMRRLDDHGSGGPAEGRQGHRGSHLAGPRRLGQAHRSDRNARRNSPPRRRVLHDGEAGRRLRARQDLQRDDGPGSGGRAEAARRLQARRLDYRPAEQWRRPAEPSGRHGGHVPR